MSAKQAGVLFKSKRFLPLFIAMQTGAFNDNLLKQSLVIMVTYGGLSFFGISQAILIPLATTLFTLPFLLLSAIAGQVADKYDRSLILRQIKRIEILIMVVAAIGFALQNTIVLMVALILMGSQSAFFTPTKNAILPQALKEDELIAGNALISGIIYVMILAGQAAATILILKHLGPYYVSAILLGLAVIGWLGARKIPAAPAPEPDLVIDYNIITKSYTMLGDAWRDKPVFRPLAGIAWFYGFGAIFLAMFPNYIKNAMFYDETVLLFTMVLFTIGAMTGALLCVILARGKEAVWLSGIGIVGVSIFSLDLYLNAGQTSRTELGALPEFFADPKSIRFIIGLFGAAVCSGLFVVPLQAMAQQRADPQYRARLLAAGAIMLNLSVNGFQLLLIWFGKMAFPYHLPFLMISVISTLVAAYTLYRVKVLKQEAI